MKGQWGLMLLIGIVLLILAALIILLSVRGITFRVKKVACVGDSITKNGYWEDNLQKSLSAERYEVAGFGVNGATALAAGIDNDTSEKGYTLQPEYDDSLAYQPDIVVIMLGTNDSKPFNWEMPDNANAAQFRADLTALVESYKALKSKPRIYLALPPTAFSDFAQIQNETIENDIIPAIREVAAATGAAVIDTHSVNKNAQDDFIDGVHPSSDAGRELLAQTVANAILGK